ncbi:MAG: hypothetical protein PQJ45_00660 [Sphaerochaetaceae bacterium]|nr:hypothetical protein [Sphaerochaetaceae bacterium]
MKDSQFDYDKYIEDTHKLGRFFLSVGVIALLLAPFVIAYFTNAQVNMKAFSTAVSKVLLIYIPSCVAEYLIYVPLLGVGGVYLSFLTGNLTNLKLPCAFSSREIAKTTAGTKEDEIIMTLSIATSALTTMLVIALGVIMIVPLTPILQNPVIKPAFDNVLPALFGALGYQYFIKDLKLSTFAMVSMVLICIGIPSLIGDTGTMIIIIGALTIGVSYLFFRRTQRKGE